MPQTLDLATWPRREHFEFFRRFDNPYFNLCADLDVTALVACCRRDGGPSFFAASVYLALLAANAVEELRYRIHGDEVIIHDVLHCGSTVLRPDDTFTFAYFEHRPSFAQFAAEVAATVERLRQGNPKLNPASERDDLVHLSVIPWVSFTSFSHARFWGRDDAVPKIVLGKYRSLQDGSFTMPVSLEVHHALADGLHAGRFYADLERRLHDLEDLET